MSTRSKNKSEKIVSSKPESSGIAEAAAVLGSFGGRVGGFARAAKLSPQERSAIAQKAANTRWANSHANDPNRNRVVRAPKDYIIHTTILPSGKSVRLATPKTLDLKDIDFLLNFIHDLAPKGTKKLSRLEVRIDQTLVQHSGTSNDVRALIQLLAKSFLKES